MPGVPAATAQQVPPVQMFSFNLLAQISDAVPDLVGIATTASWYARMDGRVLTVALSSGTSAAVT